MAPERFQGQADPRSDVFSLGLTLYEMVTLHPAFECAERAQLIERMLHADPPRPRQLDRRIPRDLETLILKAIAKEPGRRYQTAGEMAADLQRFLSRPTNPGPAKHGDRTVRAVVPPQPLAGRGQHRRCGPDDHRRHRLDAGGLDLPRPARPDRPEPPRYPERRDKGPRTASRVAHGPGKRQAAQPPVGTAVRQPRRSGPGGRDCPGPEAASQADRSASRRGDRLPGLARLETHRSSNSRGPREPSMLPSTPP